MHVRPKKSLGQNFLINPHILDKIIAASDVSKNDIILEVGPGTGNLTKKLSEKSNKIIAIEKDLRLIELLKETFKDHRNVKIIEDDILKFKIGDLGLKDGGYKIVANIPYYITSNFLRTVFEKWPKPKLIVLTIQKEVAQRIVAKPPDMNLLALSVQYFSEPEIIGYISKNNFKPVPKIDSAIIRLIPRLEVVNSKEYEELFKIIRAGFSEKRKQLLNNLSKNLKLDKEVVVRSFRESGINEKSRAEVLTLSQWELLKKYLAI